MNGELRIIDLSSLVHRVWHVSGNELDQDFVAKASVRQCREFAEGATRVAVCCDSRNSIRKKMEPTYKATREKKPESLYFQFDQCKRMLRDDGDCVFESDGYEADDLIASVVDFGKAHFESIRILSSDKDLTQLVDNNVSVFSPATKTVWDVETVMLAFGVAPPRVRDWLALAGDSSDNIKGCPGCGAKSATALLKQFGTVRGVFGAMSGADFDEKMKPSVPTIKAIHKSLVENEASVKMAYELVGLMRDAPIDCSLLLAEQTPRSSVGEEQSISENEDAGLWEVDDVGTQAPVAHDTIPAPPKERAYRPAEGGAPHEWEEVRPDVSSTSTATATQSGPSTEATKKAEAVAAEPTPTASPSAQEPTSAMVRVVDATWERALEPRDMRQAVWLAKTLFDSRLLGDVGSSQGTTAIILAGRSFGLDAMSSLRGIHVVRGRVGMAAALMKGLILSSGKCDYFDLIESTDTKSTYTAKRIKAPNASREPREVTMSFTIEEARRAELVKPGSNWVKWPKPMLRWKCIAEISREEFPDVIQNCYVDEELTG